MINKMNIVQMYTVMKDIAIDSGLVTSVVLIKRGKNIVDTINSGEYRTLIITPQYANLYKADNDIAFKLIVMDKTSEDDNVYLHSINDGIALLRKILDELSNTYGNRATVTQLQLDSGDDEGDGLITTVECDISFEFNIIDK